MFAKMFTAEQINVPPDLPPILKAYCKSVILSKPKDIISFSIDYFKQQIEQPPNSAAGYRVTVSDLHDLQVELNKALKTQPELRRVDYQVASEKCGFHEDILANILRLGFVGQDVIDLYLFMGIGATLVSQNFEMTILNLFKVFEDDQCQSKLPTAALINFVQFLASKDPSITEETIQKLQDGANGDFIDVAGYKRIFDSDE